MGPANPTIVLKLAPVSMEPRTVGLGRRRNMVPAVALQMETLAAVGTLRRQRSRQTLGTFAPGEGLTGAYVFDTVEFP